MHRRRFLTAAIVLPLAPAAARAARELPSRPGADLARGVRVQAGPVALRDAPSLRGTAMAQAPDNATGTMQPADGVLADDFRWVRLTLDETGETGWVPTWHLVATDA